MKTQRRKPLSKQNVRNPDTPLTPRQLAFVAAYVEGGVGGKAAIKAGYSERSAHALSSQLLSNPKIASAIADLAAKSAESTIADNTARRQFWSNTMNDPEVPWVARLKASELLGKTAGDFLDRVEHSGQVVQVSLNLGPPPK